MSARTGWRVSISIGRSNVVRASCIENNVWSRGCCWKSDYGPVIVTTGGNGGPPLRGNRSRYVSWCYKRRFCDDVAEPANVIRESLINANVRSYGFHWKSDHGNIVVTTGGHGGPPLRGNRSRYAAP